MRSNKRGNAFFTPCVIVLVFSMLLSVTMIYVEVFAVTGQLRQQTKQTVDETIEKQLTGQFEQLKQGEPPQITLDRAELEQRFAERTSAVVRDGCFLLNRTDGSLLCRYRIVSIREENAIFSVSGEAEFPIVFCGETVGWARIPIRMESCVKERF